MAEFQDIPVPLSQIMNQKMVRRVDLKNSIHNMIHLITISSYNEVKHDPLFGTEISEYDFENIYNTHILKDQLKKSVLNSIQRSEPRLKNVTVDLQIEQVEMNQKADQKRVKTQINMEINGIIDKTNEPLKHREVFFIGPLSF